MDGSEKATQTALLAKNLVQRGEAIKTVSFPNYGSDSSALIKMYLSGQYGVKPDYVNLYAASAFMQHTDMQAGKSRRQEFLDWLDDFGYTKLGIPKPDIVVYLDVE